MAILCKMERERLEQCGLSGAALQDVLQLGARARHESRVKDVLDWVAEGAEEAGKRIFQLMLDHVGVGGTGPWGDGASTRRYPFLPFGKGRKQASDGPAWDAAIAASLDRLRISLNPCTDAEIYMIQLKFEEYGDPFGVDIDDFESEWVHALLGETMLQSAAVAYLSCRHPKFEDLYRRPCTLWKVEGEASEWSSVYNHHCATMEASTRVASIADLIRRGEPWDHLKWGATDAVEQTIVGSSDFDDKGEYVLARWLAYEGIPMWYGTAGHGRRFYHWDFGAVARMGRPGGYGIPKE